MRAALYTRVSTEDQAKEGYSLDAQMKRLEAYCLVRGWEIGGRYRDEGCSGRDTGRPEYMRMFSESDSWDILLVLKMDRIHRNSVNFALMMADLRKNGKEFTSMQEKFDTTTAMGRFVMDIMQRIAQLESEQIGERVKIGMTRKPSSERARWVPDIPTLRVFQRNLEVVEDEAYTVKAIYRLYGEGSTMEEIAESLNKAKIPAKRRFLEQAVRLQYPSQPDLSRIHRVGRNRQESDHAAIIGLDEYEAVNGPFDG